MSHVWRGGLGFWVANLSFLMQRHESGLVIIARDFCGADWDEVLPMIEGHHGSVICLECFRRARTALAPGDVGIHCTLCLRDLPADHPHWRHPSRPDTANAHAVTCDECIDQAAGTFDKDSDVPWSKDDTD